MEQIQITQSQINPQIQISQNVDIEQLINNTVEDLLQASSPTICHVCFKPVLVCGPR